MESPVRSLSSSIGSLPARRYVVSSTRWISRSGSSYSSAISPTTSSIKSSSVTSPAVPRRPRDVEAGHIRARHHHRPPQRVLELKDLVDHLPLLALDDPFARAHVDQRAQLFFRELGLLGGVASDEPDRQRGEAAQHGADAREREDRAEPADRSSGQPEEPVGILHRQR